MVSYLRGGGQCGYCKKKCIFEILHHEIECVLRPSPIKVKTNDNKPIKCLSSFAIATMNIFIALFFSFF